MSGSCCSCPTCRCSRDDRPWFLQPRGLSEGVRNWPPLADLSLRLAQRREAERSGRLARAVMEASRLPRQPVRAPVIGSLAELSIRLSKRYRDESIAEICRRIDRGER